MTSIRMEPVWITLGLSAGIAAAHSLAEKVAVQTIDFPRYRKALVEAGQILEWGSNQQSGWNSKEEWNQAKAMNANRTSHPSRKNGKRKKRQNRRNQEQTVSLSNKNHN